MPILIEKLAVGVISSLPTAMLKRLLASMEFVFVTSILFQYKLAQHEV